MALRTASRTTAVLLLWAGLSPPVPADALEARIRWAEYGVPHVEAADYESLGYGYGYAVARDHLCLLAGHALTLRGERSRWYGEGGTALVGFVQAPNVDSDLYYKVQLSDAAVTAALRALEPEARALAQGYAAGFNRYVRDLPATTGDAGCGKAPLPVLAETDVVRSMMMIGTIWKGAAAAPAASASVWDAPDARSAAPASTRQTDSRSVGTGSNAWAYGADVTGTGAAIVVANPHTWWRNHWLLMHQLHLRIPGELDVAGAAFVGLPMPVVGYNRDLAWSLEAPLTVDYYVAQAMQVEEDPEPAYVVDGERRPLAFRTVPLDIRRDDGSIEGRTFTIPWSHLGPLYKLPAGAERPAGWYAFTDAGEGNARGLDQMLEIAKARNMEGFSRAVVDNRGLGAHLVAGDRHGDVLYVESGPLLDIDEQTLRRCRLPGTNPANGEPYARTVFDGTSSACAIRADDGSPRLADDAAQPAIKTRGIIQQANDSYRLSVFSTRLSGYSPLLGEASAPPSLRTRMSNRHLGEIAADGEVTLEEAVDVLFSNRNYAAETHVDAILDACNASDTDSAAGACEILRDWDRTHNRSSRGALLFDRLWPRLTKIPGLYAQTFDPEAPFRVPVISTEPEVGAAIVAALEETNQVLAALGLTGGEPWGRMLAQPTHGERIPLPGGPAAQGVLNAMIFGDLGPEGFGGVAGGTGYVQVVTWEEGEPVALGMLAPGQSGAPDSPHYEDQLTLLSEQRLIRLPFSDAGIAAARMSPPLRLREDRADR